MQAPEAPVTEHSLPVRVQPRQLARLRSPRSKTRPLLIVAAITMLGAALRLIVAHQSLFRDELATEWIVTTHGLRGVVSVVGGCRRAITQSTPGRIPASSRWS